MIFEYAGDQGSRTVAWLKSHLKGIAVTIDSGQPEQGLALLYSGIDTCGLLGAPPNVTDATRSTFMPWCATYIVPRVQGVEGEPISAIDLYAARCGILHTSTPESSLGRQGAAREIWYRFKGQTGIRLLSVLPQPALRLDVEVFAWAFRNGALAFLEDMQKSPAQFQVAENRAQHFLRWGVVPFDKPSSGSGAEQCPGDSQLAGV